MSTSPVFKCSVCDEVLQEETRNMICTTCGKEEEGEWCCPNRHYLCEECRVASPAEIIATVCSVTTLNDPVVLVNVIMHHPAFHAHGPEHHLLVAPVILTVLAESTGMRLDRTRLQAIMKRTEDIPIGACFNRGDCGASAGVGTAIAYLAQGATGSGQRRSLVLSATAQALLHLAHMGGHRCCKQSVYAALESCAQFLNHSLNRCFPSFPEKICCPFSEKISDCKKEQCPYYQP